ncbi:MAG: hypothetical protein ACREOU_02485 [Candidatus Eiseniibacteriota bacterium]
MSEVRIFLRHTVATLAYRGGKATRGATSEFGSFKVGPTTRTPREIVAHVGDLLEWALTMAQGQEKWVRATPVSWEGEVQRFHRCLQAFDAYLESGEPLNVSVERLFQGPIADALTHVGQVAMLRRLAEEPMKGENYARAQIESGRVGPDQVPAEPKNEFD